MLVRVLGSTHRQAIPSPASQQLQYAAQQHNRDQATRSIIDASANARLIGQSSTNIFVPNTTLLPSLFPSFDSFSHFSGNYLTAQPQAQLQSNRAGHREKVLLAKNHRCFYFALRTSFNGHLPTDSAPRLPLRARTAQEDKLEHLR